MKMAYSQLPQIPDRIELRGREVKLELARNLERDTTDIIARAWRDGAKQWYRSKYRADLRYITGDQRKFFSDTINRLGRDVVNTAEQADSVAAGQPWINPDGWVVHLKFLGSAKMPVAHREDGPAMYIPGEPYMEFHWNGLPVPLRELAAAGCNWDKRGHFLTPLDQMIFLQLVESKYRHVAL